MQQVLAAIRQADLLAFTVVVLTVSLITWIYDSFCLAWLIRVTLGARGTQEPIRMRQLLPLKAASYVLNLANYHAAALGMAVLVGRRKKVPFLEAAGALAVLSYLDLVAVATMTVVGLLLAPDVLGGNAALQRGVQFLVMRRFCGGADLLDPASVQLATANSSAIAQSFTIETACSAAAQIHGDRHLAAHGADPDVHAVCR